MIEFLELLGWRRPSKRSVLL